MTKPALLLLAWLPIAAAQDVAQIAGRWHSLETSKGGIGAMYEVDADGTAHFSPGAVVALPYRVAGDRLSMGSGRNAAAYKLVWTDDDHMMLVMGATAEKYSRLGSRGDSSNPIIGEWTAPRTMGENQVRVHLILGSDSNCLFMIRFLTQTGSYSIQGGRLSATFGGRGGLEGAID